MKGSKACSSSLWFFGGIAFKLSRLSVLIGGMIGSAELEFCLYYSEAIVFFSRVKQRLKMMRMFDDYCLLHLDLEGFLLI